MVSIIVPVYNVESYLRQCLDSIYNQTYKDIEVIMVDDGSKDSSGKICDEYAKKYFNFFVYHKYNEGLGMARNTGLEYIRGDYVAFVDSDDFLEPRCIEILLKKMILNKVDICKGGFKRVYDNGRIKSVRYYQEELFKGEMAKNILFPRMIGSAPTQHDSVEMCVWGTIYKSDIIKNEHLHFYSEKDLISEDLVFNMEYMQYANGACLVKDVGYDYRINTSSLTKSYRCDRFEASKLFYVTVRNKLIELKYDQNTLLRLDRIFFVYLRGCIAQENKKRSGRSVHECINKINYICNDQTVQLIIDRYPKKKLGIPQNIFLWLVHYKMGFLLYIIMKIGA